MKSKINPAGFLIGFICFFHYILDISAVLKGRGCLPAFMYTHKEIKETVHMPPYPAYWCLGRDKYPARLRITLYRFYVGKALFTANGPLRPGVIIEVQVIWIHQVESYRSLVTVDFKPQFIIGAGCNLGYLDYSGAFVLHS